MIFSERFDQALLLANDLHRTHMRKGGGIPYMSHLMSVAALVMEDGGSEDEVIAALLHDAVEDQGGAETLAKIRTQFGDEVAEIVDACSDTDVEPKPPWRARKEAHIAHLKDASDAVHRVILADKLHNTRTMLVDLSVEGDAMWQKFTTGREGTMWYVRSVYAVLAERRTGGLVDEFRRTIDAVEHMINEA